MRHATRHIAESLRQAREGKGLSQRELSHISGVPQSHISRIEAGAVDLRLSSLVQLGRALDLELVLLPRHLTPAVESIMRSSAAPGPARPAYSLDEEDDA